jgi:TP901 family phage tail tape measure protein
LADVNSNININFNTAAALAQLRQLQAGLSKFHQSLAEGNLAAANAQKGLNAQLIQSIGATGKFSASQVKVAGSTLAFTSALEKNKLSLREYYRYTMAAATANTRVMGKAFAQEREIINRARRDRVKALQAQYIQMNKANSGFMDAIRIMPKSLQMASGRFTELGTRIQYAAQRQQFLNQLLKQGSTQLLNFGKNTQWAGRQLMVGLTMPLALFGASAAKTFRDLETEIVKFRRVYGDAFTNDAETDAAVNNIRKLATEYTKYGVAVNKTVEMAATAAAAGFSGAALTAQVETATKLAVLGQVEQQQALETTISLQSAFGISSEELAKKIDFLNAVENQTLLSIEDLTIAIPKAAPVVKQLGGNVEDLAFFLTAMKEGGINASEGANALKSGLASLINPAEKSAKFLAELGININAIVESNAGDIKSTVIDFANALDTLDPLNRARAIEQLFGKFQFSRLSTLFQNVVKDGSQASRALDLAGSSVEELAVLSEREMKKIEDSVGVKFQAAIEQFKQDIMPLGKIFLEALTPVIQFFGNLFEKFNGLSDNTKKVIAIIVGAVAGLGPVVLMTFGLLMNGIANVIKLFALLRGGIAKLNGQTNVMGAGFNYMTQEQIENAASSQQLHQTHTRLVEVFNVERTSVNALASSYNSLSTQMRTMASQNPALFSGGVSGAKTAVSKLPPVRKYQDGILSVPGPKGAGDVVPAMLSPGEAVIPTDTTNKYRGLITAMFQDKVPGFMAGRIPGGPARMSLQDLKIQRVQEGSRKTQQQYPGTHPEKQSGSTFVGMPKSAAEASQSRQILDKISGQVSAGRFGTLPPTDFGTMLQSFSGRSFPARGVGGVYRKPNGQIVVVKPTIDDKTALAEVRATQIARDVHGLVAPKQSIRTMMDPTDPTGKRKFIVIESPYDPRIAAASGKFTKSDMVKQLVASTLRGDKDLQRANLSGNVLSDVGTAGVFDRASGFRDFAKAMPSMEQQAVVNLLGVKGGAKKFFAQETSGIAASMTPAQYDAAIKGEINRSIPRLEKVVKSFNLDPQEQVVYGNMIKRLKDGAKTDWTKLHPMHARAGEGIAKLELGNFEKFKNVPESKDQIDRLVKGLSEDAVKQLEKLPKEQKERVLNAINKQKPAPTHMSQNRMIKFVEDNMIYKDGLFYDKKSIDAGHPNAGKSYDEVMKKVFYQMGLREKDGAFVSDKKINVVSKLKDAMSPLNKAGGGWRTNIPKDSLLYKVLDNEEQSFRAANAAAGKNDPLRTVREKLSSLGYTEKQIATALRSELSHLEKTGEAGRGPNKYSKGSALFDLRLLNNYMNTTDRASSILNWNDKNGNALGLTPEQAKEFRRAAEYMKPGSHPQNANDIRLVQRAAQLDVLADDYLKAQPSKPKGFPKLGQVNTSKGLLALIEDRLGTGYYNTSKPVFNLASAKDRSQAVLVDPRNEFKVDTVTGRIERLTSANTGPKPPGAVSSTGSPKDRRTATETATQRIATRSQARRFGRGFVMPGRIAGDPGLSKSAQGRITNQMQEQARLLKQRNNLSRQEFDKAMSLYRRRLVLAEIEKRNELEKQRVSAAERKSQAQTLQSTKEIAKQKKLEAKRIRQEKVGRFSGGGSMALGTAGMGMMMTGNMGAGMALMGASAVAGMAPMLAGMGPIGWVTTAALAVGGGLFLLNKKLKDAAVKQAEFIESVSATTEKMDQIGQITNKVGASRAMEEVRGRGSFNDYNDANRAGTQFGDTFLESEVGKKMTTGFVENMARFGAKQASQDFGLQLATYISDGVLTSDQAASIAEQIGVELGNRTYTTNIQAQVRKLVGPNGEDLTKNALSVRTNIIQETNKRSLAELNALQQGGGRDNAARIAALSLNNIEIVKAQNDATEWQYRKQIQILEKQLLQTTVLEKQLELKGKISKLEEDMEKDTKVTNDLLAKQIQAEVDAFKNNIQRNEFERGFVAMFGGLNENAYFDSLKSSVQEKYKDTFPGLTKQVQKDLQSISDKTNQNAQQRGFSGRAETQQFEVFANLMMGQGFTNPQQFKEFMEIYAGSEGTLYRDLQIGLDTQGPEETFEMLDFFTEFKDKDLVQTVFADIVNKDPKQFNKIGKALSQLSVLDGREVNMEVFVASVGAAGLEKLANDLDIIEAIPDVTTKEAIIKYFEEGDGKSIEGISKSGLELLMSQWENWDKLPKEIKKEAISKYKTIYETIFADEQARKDYAIREAQAASSKVGASARDFVYTKTYDQIMSAPTNKTAEAAAAKGAETYLGQFPTVGGKTTKELDPLSQGNKENPLSFLDSLSMRIKQVRDNSFNALKPVESLLAAFTNKKTKQGAFSLFDGIQNRLSRLGAGKDLRDAVASMSAEDFSKIAALKGDKALFTFEKGKAKSKDTITGLTKTGKAVNQGYNEANLGEFNLANQDTVKNIQEQSKAYRILIANGLSASQALEVVADQGQAAAIAAGAIKKGTPEWKEYIKNIKEANTALERQAVLNNAIKANEDFKMYQKMPELVNSMKELGYSTDQIDTVLGDPQLAKFLVDDLKDGKLDAEAIAEYLNNIEAKKIIDIQVKLNKGDLAGAAAEGRQLVDELFDAQEGLVRTGPEAIKMRSNERTIRDLEAQILPFQRQIALLNDQIEDGQRAIEENYTRPIEALNEEVSDLSRELEVNPLFGDRAIKKIQDENNMLSNDLSIISNAAEKVNEKYDEQAEALSKVQEINANIMEQQKQQIDLADALSQGDIAAAARAAQSMRQTGAAQFATGQTDALEQARKNAIDSLVGPQSGLTQEQINEKQFQNSQRIYQMENDPRRLEILNQIQFKQDQIYAIEEKREAALLRIRDLEDQIYNIEEKSIEPLQERIDELNYQNALLQVSIDKQIESLTVLGKTKDEWTRINAQLDASQAALNAANGSAALAGLLSAAATLNLTWGDILAKLAEYAKGVPASVQNAVNKIGNINQTGPATPGTKLPAGSDPYDIMSNSDMAKANKEYFTDVVLPAIQSGVASSSQIIDYANAVNESRGTPGALVAMAKGGLVPKYFVNGGYARGTDTVPAMLTPGEFIMSKYAVQSYGIDKMKAMNNGSSVNDSVYNYSISVNVTSDANPDEIARVVMTQIKNIDSQKLRGTRL